MKTTMTLAMNLHVSLFDIFQQDCDEVIMLINFYIKIGSNEKNHKPLEPKKPKYDSNERIRVNDKTATGGWF
jgi:hypothetical protein